jgi:hypothetical protein
MALIVSKLFKMYNFYCIPWSFMNVVDTHFLPHICIIIFETLQLISLLLYWKNQFFQIQYYYCYHIWFRLLQLLRAGHSLLMTESFLRKLEFLVNPTAPEFPYNIIFITNTEIFYCNVWLFL